MQCLKDYLTITGITTAELARRAEISEGEMHRYVNGKREPRIRSLKKISKATGITLDRLCEEFN